ncbi:hypothetical protein NM208_g14768 [Fusarium decemcellulare]|uniref:Uncharacterized protein n=1 Tax=Fusarium decemcellulare TaxID=57161 RepID=A0ACC1RF06_9HYPO|nr:hypothetical protein NM208_g14768 [Fusarium decemcellulare]
MCKSIAEAEERLTTSVQLATHPSPPRGVFDSNRRRARCGNAMIPEQSSPPPEMPTWHLKMPLLVRNMLSPLLIILPFLLPITLGCTTTSFNSTYDVYPDCAASCLACEDEAYTTNFANNCDYSSGECCTSQYHSAIAATWSCVRTNCDEELSLKAFKTFSGFCDEKKQPIEEQDIPEGYEAAVENKDSEHEKDNKDNAEALE